MNWVARMKQRWGVGLFGLVAILAAFSMAGTSILWVKTPLLDWLVGEQASPWLRVLGYVCLLGPIYQIFLLAWGTLFGQFRFFWDKQKKILLALRRLFSGRPKRGDVGVSSDSP